MIAGYTLRWYTASLLLPVAALTAVFMLRDFSAAPDRILVPVQTAHPGTCRQPRTVAPAESLRSLSRHLDESGISRNDNTALEKLAEQFLLPYIEAAMACPGLYFSERYEASSLRVIATWLSKQGGWLHAPRLPRISASGCAGLCRRSAIVPGHAAGWQPA